jgi:hypothetical protein
VWGAGPRAHRVVVEGPLAHNPLFLGVLQALLPQGECLASVDDVEGTARGAWCLMQGMQAVTATALQPAPVVDLHGLLAYHQRWVADLQV